MATPPSAPMEGPAANAANTPVGAPLDDTGVTARVCSNRPRCRIRRTRPLGQSSELEVVDVSLGRDPGADECEKSEYWLVRRGTPSSLLRLAQDCDEQWGADSLGHAETSLEGNDLVASYREMQGGDRCEGYEARLRLSPLHIAREARWDGVANGKSGCLKQDEIGVDWDHSDFRATWIREDCSGAAPGGAAPASHGLAIPKLVGSRRHPLPNGPPAAGLGSCAALLDAARAKDHTIGGAVAADASIRAVMVGDALWTEVEGGGAGTLQILTAAAAAGDGDYGSLGCTTAARPVTIITVHLADGRVDGEGVAAKSVRVVARGSGSLRLEAELPDTVGRVALSYRGPNGTRLDSARLEGAATAASLPPFAAIWDEDRRCAWESGLPNAKRDNAEGDPVLPLRPRD